MFVISTTMNNTYFVFLLSINNMKRTNDFLACFYALFSIVMGIHFVNCVVLLYFYYCKKSLLIILWFSSRSITLFWKKIMFTCIWWKKNIFSQSYWHMYRDVGWLPKHTGTKKLSFYVSKENILMYYKKRIIFFQSKSSLRTFIFIDSLFNA